MRPVISDLFRPWRTSATWRRLAFLCMDLWAGTISFSVVLPLAVTAASLIVIFPAAVILGILTFWFVGVFSRVERSRVRELLDIDLPAPPPIDRSGTRWQQLLRPFRDRVRWTSLAYLLLLLPVGALCTAIVVTVWAGSATLLVLPLFVDELPDGVARFGLFELRGGSAWIATAVGVGGLAVVAPWVTTALADVRGTLARKLLARPMKDEFEARVIQLESSRVAAVDSAESERRRIERDLHDGAQQRLIAVAMDLGVAKERLVTDPDEGQAIVAHAHEEVKAAMKELRDLVRGIHPVILEDRGLDAALSAVVARSPVPVRLDVRVDPRPVPAVESAAYFIVSEALANIARHAEARSAEVRIDRVGNTLTIRVTDDGVGGADPSRGTGLSGLADRVAALGGRTELVSPVGGPTRLTVEMPCGS